MTDLSILKRLAEIDKTLLEQDTALVDLYVKLQALYDTPKRRIGFQSIRTIVMSTDKATIMEVVASMLTLASDPHPSF